MSLQLRASHNGRLLQRLHSAAALRTSFGGTGCSRIVLFVGMAGAGKTAASQLYLQTLNLPRLIVELQPGHNQGWAVLHQAFRSQGLPASNLAEALAAITNPMVLMIDRLEVGLTEDGTFTAAVQSWLPSLLRHPLLHVVLASRVFPTDPTITALTGAGEVLLVDGADLAFRPAEIQALWVDRQGQALDSPRAELLYEACGGLAALVALACTLHWTPPQPRPPL
ncbi:MAG: hypothetical protein CYG59_24805, partial [Chloroflexi bacterium]